MYELFLNFINELIYVPDEGMVHPGLPAAWVAFVFISMMLIGLRYAFFYSRKSGEARPFKYSFLTNIIKPFVTRPWLIVSLRLFAATVFLIVIYARNSFNLDDLVVGCDY